MGRASGRARRARKPHPIGGTVERHGVAVRRPAEPVFPPHAIEAIAVVRRLDQRKSQVPQPALVVGQREFRGLPTDGAGGITPDPIMDVIVHKLGANTAEVAVGYATTEQEHASTMHWRSMAVQVWETRRRRRRRWVRLTDSIGPLGDRSMRTTGRMMMVADSDRGATAFATRTRRRLFLGNLMIVPIATSPVRARRTPPSHCPRAI